MSGSMNWLSRTLSRFERAHSFKLIISVIIFGAVSLALFWLTIKFQWLPIEFRSSAPGFLLTQEDTGLFEAIGGWALGFAGALVAIRIAGSAYNIQQNDSIREEVRMLEEKTQRVSELNAKIARAIFDAKRACTAVLIEAAPPRPKDIFNNVLGARRKKHNIHFQSNVQQHLVDKLDALIDTIEEASRDQVFRSILDFGMQKQQSIASLSVDSTPLSQFFSDADVRKKMLDIVTRDAGFYYFTEELRTSSINLGVGLNHIRSKDIHSYYEGDIQSLLSLVNNPNVTFEYSDAAWLLLGTLLLQNREFGSYSVINHGFVLLALILGSLPNGQLISAYLNNQIEENSDDYTKSGFRKLKHEADELASQLYYLNEDDLTEIGRLMKHCSENLGILRITTKGAGLSKLDNGSRSTNEPTGTKEEIDSKNSTSTNESTGVKDSTDNTK